MGFFKNVGKVLGKVGKTVGGVAAKVGHGVLSNVPLVSTGYGILTNIVNKDLGDLGDAIIGNKQATNDMSNAVGIQNGLQINGVNPAFTANSNNSVHTNFGAVPNINGLYYGTGNAQSSFDANPLFNPALVNSGATNDIMIRALLEQGVNVGGVQQALTGVAPRGKVNLESILEMISGTTNVIKDTIKKPVEVVTSNNNNVLLFGGLLGALGLGYLFLNK